MRIVILGLSITSSWGNGHATTYRSLVRGLVQRGHDVLFLERDKPWYQTNRDLQEAPFGRIELYANLDELKTRHATAIRGADFIIVGSFVPEGVAVGEWVLSVANCGVAFYDIDTPITLARLDSGETDYLSSDLVKRYDLYLSFTGGPTLERLQTKYRSPRARVLYCSVDESIYYPEEDHGQQWDLGYLGTYSDDRQPVLENLMLTPASRWPEGKFVVAGPQYPDSIRWSQNVHRVDHVPPDKHRWFYNSQRFTLNVTRADMVRAGYSPSIRLFEASACGVPIISDYWDGLGNVLSLGDEILVSHSPEESLRYLQGLSAQDAAAIGQRARARVLAEHTGEKRAAQLEAYVLELAGDSAALRTPA